MDTEEVTTLALALMSEHRLSDWSFKFDRAVRRAGYCNYREKTISLSRPFASLNPEPVVRNTILHEIAHALAGPWAGHGPGWRSVALNIGNDGKRCLDISEVEMPRAPFVGTCPTCGRTIERYRRKRIACGACCAGSFNADHLFKWARR